MTRKRASKAVRTVVVASLFCFLGRALSADAAIEADPGFIVGYATAMLEIGHSQTGFSVTYQGGVLRVDFEEAPDAPFDTLERTLLKIEGVTEVNLVVDGVLVANSSPETEVAEPDELDKTAPSSPSTAADASSEVVVSTRSDDAYDVLTFDSLFDPLLADPRWPHFSAAHVWYLRDQEFDRIGSANFGASFAFVKSPREDWGQWEIGLQAGVYSVFNLTAPSNDLINSDFLVGLTASYHFGDVDWILRVHHQSSHLGDEFLLRNRVTRINLSFEVADLLVSYAPWQWLRIYGGGGVIMHSETQLDRGIVQTGIELESPVAFLNGYVRPVAASDLQFREESHWRIDTSVRAGIQIEHPFLRRTRFQILGEFYSGRSPNGQFYDRRIKTVGIGLHLVR